MEESRSPSRARPPGLPASGAIAAWVDPALAPALQRRVVAALRLQLEDRNRSRAEALQAVCGYPAVADPQPVIFFSNPSRLASRLNELERMRDQRATPVASVVAESLSPATRIAVARRHVVPIDASCYPMELDRRLRRFVVRCASRATIETLAESHGRAVGLDEVRRRILLGSFYFERREELAAHCRLSMPSIKKSIHRILSAFGASELSQVREDLLVECITELNTEWGGGGEGGAKKFSPRSRTRIVARGYLPRAA